MALYSVIVLMCRHSRDVLRSDCDELAVGCYG